MKQKIFTFLTAICLIATTLLLPSCGGTSSKKESKTEVKKSIMVFAAASLTDVLEEIVDSFEVKYNVEVKTNMASSGKLARQIEQGGEPDVYISASKKWANYVDSLGQILKGYKSEIAYNELVLIAPLESSLKVESINKNLDFLALIGDNKLSMGDPTHVPAGKYAKQSLSFYDWYNTASKKILPAKDVRSALMYVEMNEAPVGIVYKTDALKSKKVKILNTFPEESHKPIVYVGGACSESNSGKDFFKYLNSTETKAIWEKYGFKK